MSQSSDFETTAKTATAYEMIGASGKTYVFFFFRDGSVCAAERVATGNRAAAQLDFEIETKQAMRDCGGTARGTTYQEGAAFLKQIEDRSR